MKKVDNSLCEYECTLEQDPLQPSPEKMKLFGFLQEQYLNTPKLWPKSVEDLLVNQY